ncbi:MAG: GNAT family N-acetyltransferase [Acidimicrobiales bacterium]
MTNNDLVRVEVVRAPSASIEALFTRALAAARVQRGGSSLVETILAGRTPPETLAEAIRVGNLVVALVVDAPVGFALVAPGVVQSVFVDEEYRRRGVARTILQAVIATQREVLDAFALPGDRGTKSLYESLGWKARLLTMRAD